MKLEAFLAVALPVIAALLAIGSVLWIKAMRRLQAPPAPGRDPVRRSHHSDDVATVVPARPVSGAQLERWRRRYLFFCATAGAALLAYAIWLAFGSSS